MATTLGSMTGDNELSIGNGMNSLKIANISYQIY
jgi:hypothetical protein